MKHKVLKTFMDKGLDAVFVSGSFYVSDDVNRVKALEKGGFVKANENLSSLEQTETDTKATVKRTRKKASE